VFHKFLILCCALYLGGAHWMVLQTTAWTGMLITRSMSASVGEAIESTFDGQHPCRMCEAISSAKRTGQASEKGWELLKRGAELKFLESGVLRVLPRPAGEKIVWSEKQTFFERRADAPPTPPPLS
jgi:hypothetical protein